MIKEIVNKKISKNFEIIKIYTLGIKLLGEEVKALKYQGATFTSTYVKLFQNELLLINLNIPKYKKSCNLNYVQNRSRKLLANKHELVAIKSNLSIKGRTVLPLKIFMLKNLFKVEVAVVKSLGKSGKKAKLKEEQIERDTQKEVSSYEWENKFDV